jgi:hypothetical protein
MLIVPKIVSTRTDDWAGKSQCANDLLKKALELHGVK